MTGALIAALILATLIAALGVVAHVVLRVSPTVRATADLLLGTTDTNDSKDTNSHG